MFFLNDAVTSHICTLFLHDALPILNCLRSVHPLTMYVYTSSMNACARFQRDPRANLSSVGQEWAEGTATFQQQLQKHSSAIPSAATPKPACTRPETSLAVCPTDRSRSLAASTSR